MKHYFAGRIARYNYFLANIILWLVSVAVSFLIAPMSGGFASFVNTVLSLVFTYFTVSLAVRRLHDIGWSGWRVLWLVIPKLIQLAAASAFLVTSFGFSRVGALSSLVGFVLVLQLFQLVCLIVLFLRRGTAGQNQYGAEPNKAVDVMGTLFPKATMASSAPMPTPTV